MSNNYFKISTFLICSIGLTACFSPLPPLSEMQIPINKSIVFPIEKEVVKEIPKKPFPQHAEEALIETIKIIQEKHYDAASINVDWEKIKQEYIEKVKICKNDNELASCLNVMIQAIGHSHVHVLPPEEKNKIQGSQINDEGIPENPPGDFGFLAQSGVVMLVKPGSGAEKAGIKAGYKILGAKPIEGKRLTQITGCHAEFTFLNLQNKKEIIKLVCEPNGLRWHKVGVQPIAGGIFCALILDKDIGYVRFAPCNPPTVISARKAIAKFSQEGIKGLIIDVRDNPGGIGTMTEAIMGMLIDKKVECMKFKTKTSTDTMYAYPQNQAFLGPVAILINKRSASSSEILAAAIQDTNRGTILGSNTAGACLGSRFLQMNCGLRIQTVFSSLSRLNGKEIEGIGVAPDIKVIQKRSDLINGKDTVLEAAKEHLRQQVK